MTPPAGPDDPPSPPVPPADPGEGSAAAWLRPLSSTRLAFVLCLLLAAACAAGSVLYARSAEPGSSEALRFFRSPPFLLPAALLALSLATCTARRLASPHGPSSSRWTFAGIHLGILLLCAGLLIDGLRGFTATGFYRPGIAASDYRDGRSGRDGSFPFTLEVGEASVRYHPVNLQVALRDGTGKDGGTFTVREGVSFRPAGGDALFTPRRFDLRSKRLLFDVVAGGRLLRGLEAGADGSPPAAGYTLSVLAWKEPEPAEYSVPVRFVSPGRLPEERVLRVNAPAVFEGIRFCFVGPSEDRYGNPIVGIQMTRSPGEPLSLAGGVLFGAALSVHLLARARRPSPGGVPVPPTATR